jgi:hypothetical protein
MLKQPVAQLVNDLRKPLKQTQNGQGLAGESSVGRSQTHDVVGRPDTLKKANHGDPYTFDDLRPIQQSPIAGNSKCPKVQEGMAPPPLPPPKYIEDLANAYDLGWQWGNRLWEGFDHTLPTLPPPNISLPMPLKRSRSRGSGPSAQKKGKFSSSPRNSSPTGLLIGKNSPTGDYDRQSPPVFNRTGSASSLDFWSGSQRHSRAGSVVSSMNNSLHGYEVFDAAEQNMASTISAPQSAPGSGSGAQISGFRLPPPPVELEKISSFECDICGKKVSIKRKREWR